MKLKSEIDESTVIIEDFNTFLSAIDKTNRISTGYRRSEQYYQSTGLS